MRQKVVLGDWSRKLQHPHVSKRGLTASLSVLLCPRGLFGERKRWSHRNQPDSVVHCFRDVCFITATLHGVESFGRLTSWFSRRAEVDGNTETCHSPQDGSIDRFINSTGKQLLIFMTLACAFCLLGPNLKNSCHERKSTSLSSYVLSCLVCLPHFSDSLCPASLIAIELLSSSVCLSLLGSYFPTNMRISLYFIVFPKAQQIVHNALAGCCTALHDTVQVLLMTCPPQSVQQPCLAFATFLFKW